MDILNPTGEFIVMTKTLNVSVIQEYWSFLLLPLCLPIYLSHSSVTLLIYLQVVSLVLIILSLIDQFGTRLYEY